MDCAGPWHWEGGGRGQMREAGRYEKLYNGRVKEVRGGIARYKRRENLLNFIKKTVVPYPRLG